MTRLDNGTLPEPWRKLVGLTTEFRRPNALTSVPSRSEEDFGRLHARRVETVEVEVEGAILDWLLSTLGWLRSRRRLMKPRRSNKK